MRWLGVILFAGSLASAQEQITVSNAASMLVAGTTAPGSLVLIYLTPQAGGPFTIDPTSLNVTILPNGATSAQECGIIPASGNLGQFVTPFQILAVLPTILPSGPAQLTLYNGGFSATAQITIMPSSPGLFPPSAFKVQQMGADQVQKPNQLTHPARPGDTVTLWATGLGSATHVRVLVGGRATTATSAGPAPGMPGVDQIQFVVPADTSIPNDCYVAVAVQTPDANSNTISISKTSDGSPCQSTLGLTAADLATLDGGGSVGLAQLTMTTWISPPIPRSPFGEWFNTAGAGGFDRIESALFYSTGMTALGVAQISGTAVADNAFFGCTVSPLFPDERGELGGGKGYNVGNSVTLQGSGGALDLTSPLPPPYFFFAGTVTSPTVLNPSQLPPPFFDPGTWTFSGSGGAASPVSVGVAPFSAPLTLPPEIMATNFNALQTIHRQTNLVVTWNPVGFGGQDVLTSTLSGSSVPGGPNAAQTAVICNVPAANGQLVIPSAMLQNLAPSPLVAVGGAYMQLSVARRQGPTQTFSLPLRAGRSALAVLQSVSFEFWPVSIQ
jgi:uncharacterized protein (TIGR03437 family)